MYKRIFLHGSLSFIFTLFTTTPDELGDVNDGWVYYVQPHESPVLNNHI